jgi:hypothetical protein
MVVSKTHGLEATPEVAGKMATALVKHGAPIVGNYYIDYNPRTIFNHLHWHLRPNPFPQAKL